MEVLEPLVESRLTLEQIGDRLGRTISSVAYWLASYGLKTARAAAREVAVNAPAEVERVCRRHGPGRFVRESGGFYRCARCRAANVAEWRRRTKRRLVAEAGGRCKLCGYDRCLAALHFHHLDPAAKEFALSRRGSRVRSKDFAVKRRNACFYAPTVTPRWRRVSSNRRWR